MAPTRIAVLEADSPQPKAAERYGHYTGLFTSLLSAAVAPSPVTDHFVITRHHVVNDTAAYPALDDVDAILITGSKHSAYMDDEWIVALTEFTRRAIEGGRVRVIGVCFGHQIVGRALGVEVGVSDVGWEVAVTDVELSEEGKKLFGLQKMVSSAVPVPYSLPVRSFALPGQTWKKGRKSSVTRHSQRESSQKLTTVQRIQQMHRDEVKALPPSSQRLASTPSCPVQAMYSPGRYITVQGHPEFTADIVREVCGVRHDTGLFSDGMYQDAVERAGREHDGVAIAKVFVKFLGE